MGLDAPSLTRADVEALSGADHVQSLRWWRAMGFAEVNDTEVAFGPQDVEIVTQLNTLLSTGAVAEDDILRLARLLGAAFSRLAEAQLAALRDLLLDSPESASTIERIGADPGQSGVDLVESTMNYVWRRHLVAALAHELTAGEGDPVTAVGFADLSGFSKISKRADSSEIAEIVDCFEAQAFDVVSAHEGRVVKLIGDEVMYVAEDVDDAVSIAIDLITRLDPIKIVPPLHCGVAVGPTVRVGGDVFGPTVNLASRLTDVARPDTIVVPRADGQHLLERDDIDARPVRRTFDLKGLGRTRVISVRPLRSDRGD